MRSFLQSFCRRAATFLVAFLGFGLCLSCLSIMERRMGLVGTDARLSRARDPISIPAIGRNLSGVTWNPRTGTLFAVTNSPQAVFELSPGGKVLRRIVLEGFSDTEDIAHIEGHTFAVIEERRGMIRLMSIEPETELVRAEDCRAIDLGSRHEDNKGFESLFFDPSSRSLLTMRELPPYELVSVPLDTVDGPQALRSTPMHPDVRDVAALGRDSAGRLWVLSEASARMVRLDESGRQQAALRLDAGALPLEPEGFAFDGSGGVFIVGEPDTLVFSRMTLP